MANFRHLLDENLREETKVKGVTKMAQKTLKPKMATLTKSIIAFMVFAILSVAYAQNNPNNENNKNDSGAQNTATLEDILLNDFENSEDWRAYSTTPLGDTKIKKTIQQGEIRDVFNPDELSKEEEERFKNGENHILGIKTYFKDRGFDRVETKPPHEYIIKGIGRQLSVWVLGRNFRHTLYVKMRDYRGTLHKLRLGRLNYMGWRKLTVTLPGWVPQSTRFGLMDKNLHFVSLFVESDPHEVGGTFYFYVDDLRIKVDKTEMTYPGSLIKDNW